jgi:hypothetical protein
MYNCNTVPYKWLGSCKVFSAPETTYWRPAPDNFNPTVRLNSWHITLIGCTFRACAVLLYDILLYTSSGFVSFDVLWWIWSSSTPDYMINALGNIHVSIKRNVISYFVHTMGEFHWTLLLHYLTHIVINTLSKRMESKSICLPEYTGIWPWCIIPHSWDVSLANEPSESLRTLHYNTEWAKTYS